MIAAIVSKVSLISTVAMSSVALAYSTQTAHFVDNWTKLQTKLGIYNIPLMPNSNHESLF